MAIVELTSENFESTITQNPFVVVDYWAPWCGPCRSFAPVYEKVSNDHDNIVFAKVNTEEEQQLAAHFQIRSIPTLMIFRDQVIIFSQAGALPESSLRDLLAQASALDMDKVRADMAQQQAAANND
ncbi:Thioredoxin-2 [Thiorhodovibrio winogradskyi]|uniref:Thioredoxin n=1 Tax=Thiorhodovibrio winogradskyi TaxID=77007 RepID=A0ABZ0S5P0_9GAMM|nr:thioredoxin [Thiorhodovibrio winogradskyi]